MPRASNIAEFTAIFSQTMREDGGGGGCFGLLEGEQMTRALVPTFPPY